MIQADWLLTQLQALGLGFYTGVPDSALESFCRLLGALGPEAHSIAADEGAALAEAAGYTLASAQPAVVYLQNSGFGNLVNPLVSLMAPEVCRLPVLLLIGWRGAPDLPDEPQHRLQGRSLPALLAALEIPSAELPAESDQAADVLQQSIAGMRESGRPHALLVRPGCLSKSMPAANAHPTDALPSRAEVLAALLDGWTPEMLIFATTGHTCRELEALRQQRGLPETGFFLNVGAMGHTAAIALGYARQCPEREVICLDGDGALLMHAGTLATIGRSRPRLLHILLNNGVHDSVGAPPIANPATDFTALARACGYAAASPCEALTGFRAALAAQLGQAGPRWLEMRIRPGSPAGLPRPASSPRERVLGLQPDLRLGQEA